MGTRAMIVVNDAKGDMLVRIYRQSDGYPSGLGAELRAAFGGMQLVNGLLIDDGRSVANGMGCFAAQLIAKLKDGPGEHYILGPNDLAGGCDYVYVLGLLPTPNADSYGPQGVLSLRVFRHDDLRENGGTGKPQYDGPLSDYAPEGRG